jgi:hypothetical protein
VIETRQYDKLNRLTNLQTNKGNNILTNFTYTLDKVGHRQQIVEKVGTNNRTVNYTYGQYYSSSGQLFVKPAWVNWTHFNEKLSTNMTRAACVLRSFAPWDNVLLQVSMSGVAGLGYDLSITSGRLRQRVIFSSIDYRERLNMELAIR